MHRNERKSEKMEGAICTCHEAATGRRVPWDRKDRLFPKPGSQLSLAPLVWGKAMTKNIHRAGCGGSWRRL